MKLYTTTGTATDGTITQKAITDALSGKLDSTATASKATQLENSQTVRVNLASTDTATFNGTAGITPGVTGTLDVANGGTGVTSIANIKAGKDSAGNVISDTYVTKTNSISSFSTSGTTVTFKNSSGETLGNFNTQDTTYSVGNGTTAGITKLYTSTGTNTDGTMTQAAIKTAVDSKMSSTTNVNNVAQAVSTTNGNYPIILKNATTTSSATTTTIFASGVTVNPSTKTISATTFSGNATTATKATQDSAGNVITDTYVTKTNSISGFSTSGTTVTFKNSAGTTLGTFTTQDSHYTSKLVVGGSSATVSAATTNGNTYVRLFDNTTVRNSYKVAGSGATTVTSDSSGNITIASTNTTYSQANASTLGLIKLYTGTGTNTDGTMTQSAIKTALDSKLNASAYTQFTGATSSTAGVGGYVPGASAGQENYVLYGNGSWGPLPNQTVTNDSYIGIHLKAYNSRFSEIVAATSVVGTSGAGPRIGVKLKSNSGYSEILPATTQNTISVYVKNTSGTYDKL